MTKKKLYLLGLLTLIGFPLLSIFIHYFTFSDSFLSLFSSEYSFYIELLIGIATGWGIATIGWRIMCLNFMKKDLNKYLKLFSFKDLSFSVIFFVSISAGIGEEIFFRGVLQPFLGVVITGVLFVAVHGYINPKNWRISIYGLYMTIGIIVIGVLTEKVGLITAIISHTVIDITLLLKTKKALKL